MIRHGLPGVRRSHVRRCVVVYTYVIYVGFEKAYTTHANIYL